MTCAVCGHEERVAYVLNTYPAQTMRQIADTIGISLDRVSRILRNAGRSPSPEHWRARQREASRAALSIHPDMRMEVPSVIEPDFIGRLISYDAQTGLFVWRHRPESMFATTHAAKAWNTKFASERAFTHLDSNGYFDGRIFRKLYRAHRIAWAVSYGEWPDGHIDHINGIRSDNRLENLRVVDGQKENAKNLRLSKNNTSGVTGVYLDRSRNLWVANIREGRKTYYLGSYRSINEAAAARKAAERRLGFHENHGKKIDEHYSGLVPTRHAGALSGRACGAGTSVPHSESASPKIPFKKTSFHAATANALGLRNHG